MSNLLADIDTGSVVDGDKLMVSENDDWAEDCFVSISRKMVIKRGATADINLLRKGAISDGLKMNT